MDLRPEFQRLGIEPRVQGQRGTCSVFAIAGALEYALARRSGSGERLSVEFLNWASNAAIGETEDGGFFSDLWTGFETYGVCGEQDWPYRDKFDPLVEPSEQAQRYARERRELGLRLHWIKPWNPHTGLTDVEFRAIQRSAAPAMAGVRRAALAQSARVEGRRSRDGSAGGRPRRAQRAPGRVRGRSELAGWWPISVPQFEPQRPRWLDDLRVRPRLHERRGVDRLRANRNGRAAVAPVGGLRGPLELAPAGRNRRVSSNQQPAWHTENLDMNWLMPGQSVEMPIFEGPGVITHIWFTSHAGWVGELNALESADLLGWARGAGSRSARG